MPLAVPILGSISGNRCKMARGHACKRKETTMIDSRRSRKVKTLDLANSRQNSVPHRFNKVFPAPSLLCRCVYAGTTCISDYFPLVLIVSIRMTADNLAICNFASSSNKSLCRGLHTAGHYDVSLDFHSDACKTNRVIWFQHHSNFGREMVVNS